MAGKRIVKLNFAHRDHPVLRAAQRARTSEVQTGGALFRQRTGFFSSVSKPYLSQLLRLSVEQKQIPQVVGKTKKRETEWTIWKGTSRAQGSGPRLRRLLIEPGVDPSRSLYDRGKCP